MMQETVKSRATQVLRVLSGLDTCTGFLVLSEAINMVAEHTNKELFGSVKIPPVKRRVKSERHLFKVERDQAIMDYIHAQEEPLVVMRLHCALVEKFGPGRAPSKSSLYRYLEHIGERSEATDTR